MDVDDLRRHIARVLVEGLLRRAGFRSARVAPVASAAHPDTLLVWKEMPREEPLRMLTMTVSYCPDVERALTANAAGSRAASAERPDYRIVVTDRPAPGRACFQAVAHASPRSDTSSATVDLHELRALGMDRKAVEEHEELVRRLFPVLSGTPHAAPAAPIATADGSLTATRL
jgi:hypothetical protein